MQRLVEQLKKIPSHYIDIIFLSAIVLLSIFPYILNLGFYSDDWDYLARFNLSQGQSLTALFDAINTPHTQMRPVHLGYFAVLFKLFGNDPRGYHVVNTFVFMLIATFLYLVLRQIKLSRIISLSIPLIFILLPNYSTTRFWFASFQINLSLLCYVLSLYSGITFLQKHTRIVWLFVSLLFAVMSMLSYEVVIPLFLLNCMMFYYFASRKYNHPIKRWVLVLSTIGAFVAATIFKIVSTTRLDGGLVALNGAYLSYIMTVIKSSLYLHYGSFGIALPYFTVQSLVAYFDITNLVVSISSGIIIFSHLYYLVFRVSEISFNKGVFIRMILMGFVVFFLGYAIFFVTDTVQFYDTGIANRVGMAASLGVAITIIGGIGFMCTYIRSSTLLTLFFSFSVSLLCASGVLINTTIASFWERAYIAEQKVLSDITSHVPSVGKNSTILLDEVCPYIGPAIVFESSWDLKAALQLHYRDTSLKADIVKHSIQVRKEGIYTKIYDQQARYPYKQLFVYNRQIQKLIPVNSYEDAQRYFARYKPEVTPWCVPGTEGKGAPIY